MTAEPSWGAGGVAILAWRAACQWSGSRSPSCPASVTGKRISASCRYAQGSTPSRRHVDVKPKPKPKWNRKTGKDDDELHFYPTGLVVELASDCSANRTGWPSMAPHRHRHEGINYWDPGK